MLLLDDVLSELDSSRQNQLLDAIQDIQTMITCTGLEDFVNHRFHIDKIFKVEEEKLQAKIKSYRYTGCRKTVKDHRSAV